MRHHKILVAIALLIACFPAGVARANLQHLWMVNYTCHPVGLPDHVVWRVYAQFTNPGDRLIAVYATPANPVTISGAFYQSPLNGNTAPDIKVIAKYPEVQWDTFCTIGLAVNNGSDQTTTFSLPPPPFTNDTNVVWSMPGFALEQGAPDADNMVLICQLTIPLGGQSPNIRINIRYHPAGSLPGGTIDVFNVVPVLLPLSAGDVNHDFNVDVQDLMLIIQGWGTSGQGAPDVTDDGTVDVADLLKVIEKWDVFTGSCS